MWAASSRATWSRDRRRRGRRASPKQSASAPKQSGSPPQQSRIYFRATDLDGIDQFAGLMSRFIPIISNGIVCNLHTTKGPKPILLSLVGYEVRWQAIKSAQKRYKLHLRDVLSVEVGKQTRYHFIHFTFIIIYKLTFNKI